MRTTAPTSRPRRTLALGRGWVVPGALVGLFLVGAYLPAHGISGLSDLAAAALTTLGMLAGSIAASRLVRGLLVARPSSLVLIGSGPEQDSGTAASAVRRIAAVVAGATVSAGLTAASAALLASIDPTSPGHAVTAIALFANVGLLLSNLVPAPPWPGWMLLLALLDDRLGRAVPIARGIFVAEATLLASLAVIASDGMLLVLAGWLVWHGWIQTAIARADDAIGRYLAARRLIQLAREVSVTAAPEELAMAAARRRDSDHALIAVLVGGGVVGIVGPRQLPGPSIGERMTCGAAMVPLERLTLLNPDAAATAAVVQLERHGFALLRGGGGALRGVEVGDVLERLLMTAAVAHTVRQHALMPTSCDQDETASSARLR